MSVITDFLKNANKEYKQYQPKIEKELVIFGEVHDPAQFIALMQNELKTARDNRCNDIPVAVDSTSEVKHYYTLNIDLKNESKLRIRYSHCKDFETIVKKSIDHAEFNIAEEYNLGSTFCDDEEIIGIMSYLEPMASSIHRHTRIYRKVNKTTLACKIDGERKEIQIPCLKFEFDIYADREGNYKNFIKIEVEVGPLLKVVEDMRKDNTKIKVQVLLDKLPIKIYNSFMAKSATPEQQQQIIDFYRSINLI